MSTKRAHCFQKAHAPINQQETYFSREPITNASFQPHFLTLLHLHIFHPSHVSTAYRRPHQSRGSNNFMAANHKVITIYDQPTDRIVHLRQTTALNLSHQGHNGDVILSGARVPAHSKVRWLQVWRVQGLV